MTDEDITLRPGKFRFMEFHSWFRSAISRCNSQNGVQLVNEIIQKYKSHEIKLPGHFRNDAIDELLEVCYKLRIEDSQLIKQIFDLYYGSIMSFEHIHYTGILKWGDYSETGGKENATSNETDFLAFYLEHARRLKLEYDGIRLIDILSLKRRSKAPVFMAEEMCRLEAVLQYLQFGADIDIVKDPEEEISWGLEDTLHSLLFYLYIWVVKPAKDLSLTDSQAIQEYCRNLNYEARFECYALELILRALKYLPDDILGYEFIIHHKHGPYTKITTNTFINHPTVHLMLPTLNQRHGCPIQLQHACRWVIRNRLNENWQLPVGIYSLPIPKKMKDYLNLLSD